MKTCSKCRVLFPPTQEYFYGARRATDGLGSRCKSCVKAAAANSYDKNRPAKIASAKAWKAANPHKQALYEARWLLSDPERAERLRETKRKSAEKRKVSASARRRDQERSRWANDLGYRLGKIVAHQIRRTVVHGKDRRGWSELVGYTADDLRRHLERQFTRGMSWENYGTGWHIDHIRPVALYDFTRGDEEVRACWSLSNLRPLSAQENLRKGARVSLLA